MLIIQISDTHIVEPGELAYGVADTDQNLLACISHINSLSPKPELVLLTGDISNSGKREELLYAKSLLERLEAPYYVIPGNHESRDDLWSVFSTKSCPARVDGFINYVIDKPELRFIALDSTHAGQPGGKICPTRANWLDQQLAKQPDKHSIIFMHHPPVKCGVPETDKDGFIGIERFTEVIKKYSCIKAILCGHIHLQAHIHWLNTIVSIAPSTQMPLVLDLSLPPESRFYLDKPAFQMHYWTKEQNLISYPVSIQANQTSYFFDLAKNM